jgi:hypothetical protein
MCSSVIPYITDQLAMARLPRATFALMLALLPMFATLIGAVVLRQIPTVRDLAGLALVIAGVALHRTVPPGAARTRAAESATSPKTASVSARYPPTGLSQADQRRERRPG